MNCSDKIKSEMEIPFQPTIAQDSPNLHESVKQFVIYSRCFVDPLKLVFSSQEGDDILSCGVLTNCATISQILYNLNAFTKDYTGNNNCYVILELVLRVLKHIITEEEDIINQEQSALTDPKIKKYGILKPTNHCYMESLVGSIKELIQSNQFQNSEELLYMALCKMDLPLEMLWWFHNAQLVSFVCYINENPSCIKKYGLNLYNLLSIFDESEISANPVYKRRKNVENIIATDVLTILFLLGQNAAIDIGDSEGISVKNCSEMLNHILTEVLNVILLPSDIVSFDLRAPVNYMKILCKFPIQENKKKFRMTILNESFLSKHYAPPVNEVISNVYNMLKENNTSHQLKLFLSEVMSELDVIDILKVLNSLMLEGNINWRIVLPSLTILFNKCQNEPIGMKKIVHNLLKTALLGFNRNLLESLFIFARACCHLQPPEFQSYSFWFNETFCQKSIEGFSCTKNPDSFKFLIDTLTDLVPFEPVICLRIHINKVPAAPPNCQSILRDYVQLAKTRLKDLNESNEPGLFGSWEPNTDEDIEKVLSHFERTHQITKVLQDAWVLRRQYYENEFLPKLLSPPYSQNKTDFINMLVEMGKIPQSWLQKYGTSHKL